MRAARFVVAITAFAAFAACGGKPGKSICDNTVPPPAACMSQCDPSPAAANTCPSGYHCAADGFCDALCTPGGNECGDGYTCTADGRCKGDGECEGLECNVTACMSQSKPETSISGTIYAPNGTLPLYGITVYIPNAALPAMPDGAQCSRCSDNLPGSPLARATTDEMGKFTIQGNVPSGQNIPLVITSGKWRRQITIPSVGECADTVLSAADTSLPKNRTLGDIPKIAISTGSADALECLVRKLGIEDSEIGTGGGDQRIHLFATPGSGGGQGANKFAGGFAGGSGDFKDAETTLYNSSANLNPYDIVIFSCEGGKHPESKSQPAFTALKAYADQGGRVFMSHWHNVWIAGAAPQGPGTQANTDWQSVATWNYGNDTGDNTVDIIDEVGNPKGNSFATWMLNVGGSMTRAEIRIENNTGKQTCNASTAGLAERWVYWVDQANGNAQRTQNFQFTTPVTAPADQKCGKVVFSDMHVSGDSDSSTGTPFPGQCSNSGLTPQEKALAFMLFDLSSCVGVLL